MGKGENPKQPEKPYNQIKTFAIRIYNLYIFYSIQWLYKWTVKATDQTA